MGVCIRGVYSSGVCTFVWGDGVMVCVCGVMVGVHMGCVFVCGGSHRVYVGWCICIIRVLPI